jgi:prepilin-type N-terminal cleavage/methylation domain-containing protein
MRNRRARLRRRRGITLIEMLLAVTLVSMLSVGILYAMRIGLDAMDRTNRRFTANRRVLGAQRVATQQLANMIPALASCTGRRDIPGAVFFLGEPTSIRFVSSYTLEEAARGYPRIVEYLVIPGDRGLGVRLVMNEIPYTGPPSLMPYCAGSSVDGTWQGPALSLTPVAPGPRPFVLADQLAYCRISYLRTEPRTGQQVWQPNYRGAVLPSGVRIEMAPLAPRPAELQMGTITVPIRVNRTGHQQYVDIEPEENQ